MQSNRVRLGLYALRWFLPLGLTLIAIGLFQSTRNLEAYSRSPFPLPPSPRFDARITLPNEASRWLDEARVPVEFRLLRGETAADVFEKLGLDGIEVRQATNVFTGAVDPRRLRAGNRYSAFFNPDSSLASFEMTLAGSGRVQMVRRDGRWESDWHPFARTVELSSVRGKLESSLEESIRAAGGPSMLAYRLSDVFQWDLDFTKDLRRGDSFEVLFQEVRLDGEFHEVGTIYAAIYDNHGRVHEAYRYGEASVYYDGEGRPMRKMFLRSPLRYSRITSQFSRRRFHPVLKTYRPHYGVDYGAPVGTPVQVTAGGTVTFAGWDRGGGKVVKVQHSDGYMTAYLHLSRFGSGIRPGARVRQGDIIAFTGATGLASGPHLDYRVKKGNTWIDPLGLKSVREEPIPTSRLAAFRAWRDDLRAGMRDERTARALRIPGLDREQQPQPQLAVRPVEPRQAPAAGVAR